MDIKLLVGKCSDVDTVVIPVFQDEEEVNTCEGTAAVIKNFRNKELFIGNNGEIFFFTKESENTIKNIILVGLGKKNEIDMEKIRISYSKVLKKIKELKVEKAVIKFFEIEELCKGKTLKAITEGIILGNYKFDKYKSGEKKETLKEIIISNIPKDKKEKLEEKLQEALVLAETTLLARNLVNEPANVIYPETLAEEAKKAGIKYGFDVEVFDEAKIKNLGMDAFLSVAKASANPPRFIVMRYFGDSENKEDILGLVGKGLTYDSGGYSLKSNDGMVTMKCDMGGSAAVIGAISAIAKQKLNTNVIAVVAACENLIAGNGYKPGDIIGSMAGKSIEVLNTDAEGRLTLVDAVHYVIDKEKATKIVDIATLTGAVLGALGNTTTGVVTNNDEFYGELIEASKLSGEKFWQLPAFDEYKELIKSDVADLKNVGGKYAGTVTAGLFIGEFVQGKPWLHLDIAGTAWADGEKNYLSKGGTGAGVRTLYYLAKGHKSCGCKVK